MSLTSKTELDCDMAPNYFRNPALLSEPPEKQIISWLIPAIPIVLLIECCVYARRLGRV
jgi:hypothetical protein